MPLWPWRSSKKSRADDAVPARSPAAEAAGNAFISNKAHDPVTLVTVASSFSPSPAAAIADKRLQQSTAHLATVCSATAGCGHPCDRCAARTGFPTGRHDLRPGQGTVAGSPRSFSASSASPPHRAALVEPRPRCVLCDTSVERLNVGGGLRSGSCESSNGWPAAIGAAWPLISSGRGEPPITVDGSAGARWPKAGKRFERPRRRCQLQPIADNRRTVTAGGRAPESQGIWLSIKQENHLLLSDCTAADCSHRLQCLCHCSQPVSAAAVAGRHAVESVGPNQRLSIVRIGSPIRSVDQEVSGRYQLACAGDDARLAYAFSLEERLTAYHGENPSSRSVGSTEPQTLWQPHSGPNRCSNRLVRRPTPSAADSTAWKVNAAGLDAAAEAEVHSQVSSCMSRTPHVSQLQPLSIGKKHTSATAAVTEIRRSSDSAASASTASLNPKRIGQLHSAWPSFTTGLSYWSNDLSADGPNRTELDCPGDAAVWHRQDCGCSSGGSSSNGSCATSPAAAVVRAAHPPPLQNFHCTAALSDGYIGDGTSSSQCSCGYGMHVFAGRRSTNESRGGGSGGNGSGSSSSVTTLGIATSFIADISRFEYNGSKECCICCIDSTLTPALRSSLVANGNGASRDSVTWSTGSHEADDGRLVWQRWQLPGASSLSPKGSICEKTCGDALTEKCAGRDSTSPSTKSSFGRSSLPSLPAISGASVAARDSGPEHNSPSASAGSSFNVTDTVPKEFRKVSAPAATVTTTLLDALHAKYCTPVSATCQSAPTCKPDGAAGFYSDSVRNDGKGRTTNGTAKRSKRGGDGSPITLASRAKSTPQDRPDQAAQRKSSGGMKMFGDVSKLFQLGRPQAPGSTTGRSRSLGENNISNLGERSSMVTTRADGDCASAVQQPDPAGVSGSQRAQRLPQHVQRQQQQLKVPLFHRVEDESLQHGDSIAVPASPDAQAAAAERRSTAVVRKFSLSPRFPRRLAVQQQPLPLRHGEDSTTRASRQQRGVGSGASKLSLGFFKWGKLTTDQLDALEACAWLMEAGFPQYVQLFEEHRLLVDTAEVANDHRHISENLLKPLYRRLHTLAKLSKLNVDLSAAGIKLDCTSAGHSESGSSGAGGALSFNWRIERKSRKWLHAPRCVPSAAPLSSAPTAAAAPTGSAASHCRDVDSTVAVASVASVVTSSSATPNGSSSSSSDSCDSALGGSSNSAAESSLRPAAVNSRLQYGRSHSATAPAAAAAASEKQAACGNMATAVVPSASAVALSRSSDSVVSPAELSCSSPDASLEEEEEEDEEEAESRSSASSSASSSSSPSSASSSPALSAGQNRRAGGGGSAWTGTGRRRHHQTASHSRRKHDASTSVMALPAAAGAERQLVIGEPVLIRSAETDERLRRLGCLDLATVAAAAAAERDFLSSACLSCGAPPHVETMYLLPVGHVFGTFPVSLVSRPVRRACGRCGAPPLPPKAKGATPSGALASRPPQHVGAGGSVSSAGAATALVRPSDREASATGGIPFSAPSLTRSPSIYDNMPQLCTSGGEPAITTGSSMPSLDGGEVRQLSNLDVRRQRGAIGSSPSSSAATDSSENAAGRAATAPPQQLLLPPTAAGTGQISPEDRRDSGVGLSLQREPASSKAAGRKRTTRGQLWRGFAPSQSVGGSSCRSRDVWQLSAAQLSCLRKLCLLKITAQLEEHCPRDVANSILSGLQNLKVSQKSIVRPTEQFDGDCGGVVFGVSLCVTQRTEGYPLPACIRQVMATLRTVAKETVGVFRRPGVRSRIQKLRNEMDARRDVMSVDGIQAYDLADLLKQFFRELPEPLFTDKLSEVFLAIHQYVPPAERMDAMRAAVVLMPCENREALRDLIEFLALVAGHASTNQMTTSNLAVCFAPSLFSLASFSAAIGGHAAIAASSRSPKVPRKNSGPPADHIGELLDQKYAHECLKQMLDNGDRLFEVPEEFASYSLVGRDEIQPSQLAALLKDSSGSYRVHVDECIRGLLKEFRRKPKGWLVDRLPAYVGIESLTVTVGHKETAPRDGCLPLPLWRASIDIEAPPVEVLTRLVFERSLWDDDASSSAASEERCCRRQLDGETELIHYKSRAAAAAAACAGSLPSASDGRSEPGPSTEERTVDHVLLRSWRTQLEPYPGTCVLITHSVDPDACTAAAARRPQQQLDDDGPAASGRSPATPAITYASHYIVEPCGAGKSRVTHMSCVDLLGRMPAWYERHYACRVARALARLRESFRRQHACMAEAGVPETSV